MSTSTRTWMDDQRKDHIDPKIPTKGTVSNNCRPITCLPMMWKILTAQIRGELLLADKLQIVPWGKERMPQRIQRHRRATLHWSAQLQREQDETEKSSYGLDWQQKDIWYSPTKLDNKLPKNGQNIRWSHKLYRENHENLESGIDSKGEKFS